MGTAGALNDNADVTSPVDAYWPNDYGLYCIAGNVNEWVMDVYRQLSFETSDEFMMSGGLPFFYNPANVAHTDAAGYRTTSADGFNGVNKVVSGTEFTLSDLRNWMCDLTAYGTKNKLFITNDDSYKMIYDLA
jgi:formylglycine-generating enzyme required for sulfatase activity